MHESREEFEQISQRAKAASDRQLQSCRNACYVVGVTEAGMSHMGYSDVPLLAAFGDKAKEEQSLQCLKDLGGVVANFFIRALDSSPEQGTGLRPNQYPAITVTTYGPR